MYHKQFWGALNICRTPYEITQHSIILSSKAFSVNVFQSHVKRVYSGLIYIWLVLDQASWYMKTLLFKSVCKL